MKLLLTILTAMAAALTVSFSADEAKPKGEGKEKPKADPEVAFKKLDKDADGAVSLDEFKASPRGQKEPAKAEEYFKKKDKDSNGKLSLEEFKAGGPKKDKGGDKAEKPADAPKAEEKKPETK